MNNIQLQQISTNRIGRNLPYRNDNVQASTKPEKNTGNKKALTNVLLGLATVAVAGVAIAKRKDISELVKKVTGKFAGNTPKGIAKEAAERTARDAAAKEAAENAQKRIFSVVDSTVGKSAKESAQVFIENDHKKILNSLRGKAVSLREKLKADPTNRELLASINDLVGPVKLNELIANGQITEKEAESLRKFLQQANAIFKI